MADPNGADTQRTVPPSKQRRHVLVTGDATINWIVAQTRSDTTASWDVGARAVTGRVPGGAALVRSLLSEVCAPLAAAGTAVTVAGPEISADPAQLVDPGQHRSYATCFRFPRRLGERESVWRIRDFLGGEPATVPPESAESAEPVQPAADAAMPDVIVVEDAALGFRDDPRRWPDFARARPWVLLDMAAPIADGALWRAVQEHAERLVVVMSMADLRLSDVRISRELSWERTAGDLAREIARLPSVNDLTRCAYVIVSLGTGGAVLLSRRDGAPGEPADPTTLIPPDCDVFFDPEAIEDSWLEQRPGTMLGQSSCLVAAVARALLAEPDAPKLPDAVRRGLTAQRALHLSGYRVSPTDGGTIAFPAAEVAAALESDSSEFASARIAYPVPDAWSILQARYPDGLEPVAEDVARRGVEAALTGVPLGRFGPLLTVDRGEIESFRSLRTLIREYDSGPAPRPLNLAVFGPPGAGKSFGTKAVAKAALGGERLETMTFNLSQLAGPDDLLDALHRIRDVALRGKLPLVVWDEFDTSLAGDAYGWLHHFLAPMQDGEFQQGQLMHPLGKAIFVFAGGTSATLDGFATNPSEEFRLAKGPDFVSRLSGHVDIVGPDPRSGDPDVDPFFRIRRAILLRSMLLRDRPALFAHPSMQLDIDPGVLRAFLEVPAFRHGARSIETIVAMSALHGAHRFERSALPATEQLDAHVDAEKFMDLVERYVPDGDVLERLARAVHEAYRADLGSSSDALPALVEWDELPDHLKQMNRAAARDIPRKLAVLGYVLRQADGAVEAATLAADDRRVERLARYEHERWMTRKLKTGWQFGATRDDAKRLHPSIRPWDELSTSERDKDRLAVVALPRVVRAAGMGMARVESPAQIAVAVTGHRVLAEPDRVSAGVDEALSRIAARNPGRQLTLVSALAEGADRIAVRYALTHPETRVVAVLPFPRQDYLADFATTASKCEFESLLAIADEVVELPCPGVREDGYAAAGEELLRRAAALLVVWDGKHADGPGGTADVVAQARGRGMPIAWVHAGNRLPGTDSATSLGTDQGRVTYERL